MTSIVGVLCKDGVVIGCDSSTTFGDGHNRIMEQPSDKLHLVNDMVVIAGTGSVGLGQRFCAIADAEFKKGTFQKAKVEVGKALSAAAIRDFAETGMKPGQYGALIAWHAAEKFHLCEFEVPTFQPELKSEKIWYCSMGSAQLLTDPFLGLIRRVFWKNGPPSVQDGAFAVAWTLQHAIDLNTGGVNGPMTLSVLEKGRDSKLHVRRISDDERDEHLETAKEAERHLAKFKDAFTPTNETAVPPKA